MGEQTNPGDSIDYVIPTFNVSNSARGDNIFGYFGLPMDGQTIGAGADIDVSALPFRAYNLIWNEWFRDENLQNSVLVSKDDGPDAVADFTLLRRGKRKDYITGCLPFPQKGDSVSLPLGTTAPVLGIGVDPLATWSGTPITPRETGGALGSWGSGFFASTGTPPNALLVQQDPANAGFPLIYADLSAAAGSTVNALRQSFQVQKLLERDARGGTRYTEILKAHFGVTSPDARLQRPEYLGGGSTPITVHPIADTAGVGSNPLGYLGAAATGLASNHGFTQSFVEHGYVIGLASVRADLNYQQGVRKLWSRSTRYDFYFPVFAALGEQAVLTKELWCRGDPTVDNDVFGYQERWAEYRYHPPIITGYLNSKAFTPIDFWHAAQVFNTQPLLNDAFIQENPPIDRVIAVPTSGQEFLCDMFFSIKAARPLPMYSVPGLIDHF